MGPTTKTADIGLIGLAVMGENLVLNMESHGFTVAVFNRTTSRVDAFVEGEAQRQEGSSARTRLASWSRPLEAPRKIMIMVEADGAVDHVIDELTPLARAGRHPDRRRRFPLPRLVRRTRLEIEGRPLIGPASPAGEEGALKGPSIMPGGDPRPGRM